MSENTSGFIYGMSMIIIQTFKMDVEIIIFDKSTTTKEACQGLVNDIDYTLTG